MRFLLGAAVVALVAVLAAGCGSEGLPSAGNTSLGKQLFTGQGRCGSCHTLADAPGAKGTIGPNLDEAFAGPRSEGFKESTIRAIVLDQIYYPTKGSGMPAKLVTGSDADAVASYVASVAGKPVEGGGGPPPGTGAGLFASLGCQSCHSLTGAKGTGPPLNGIFGKQSKLTNGQSVTVDEAYLIESIRNPDAQIVQGYQPGVMSSVIKKGQVSQADAKKLADFIKSK